jgi:hypothetical protein
MQVRNGGKVLKKGRIHTYERYKNKSSGNSYLYDREFIILEGRAASPARRKTEKEREEETITEEELKDIPKKIRSVRMIAVREREHLRENRISERREETISEEELKEISRKIRRTRLIPNIEERSTIIYDGEKNIEKETTITEE